MTEQPAYIVADIRADGRLVLASDGLWNYPVFTDREKAFAELDAAHASRLDRFRVYRLQPCYVQHTLPPEHGL